MADPHPADVPGPLTFDASPEFYIPATSSLLERRPRTLKHGDTFALFDHYGDCVPGERSPEGVFHQGTRYLSNLQLKINGRRPLLLSSTVQDDNAVLTGDLTNPDFYVGSRLDLPRDTIHLFRAKFLWQAACYERLALRNYGDRKQAVRISIGYEADFADLFEVRGQERARRGRHLPAAVAGGQVVLGYIGLDDVQCITTIRFDPKPAELHPDLAEFQMELAPGERRVLLMIASFGGEPAAPQRGKSFFSDMREARRVLHQSLDRAPKIESSNSIFDEAVSRSFADIYMLITDTPHGPYPYAGIPWFSTAFGRDGILTAFQMLWLDPAVARGVLRFLAATQATEEDPEADAEPGKILHESRGGEMARLREVPFGLYYGSVDSTPLFVMLAGAYFDRTLDLRTVSGLWPNIEAALAWIDGYGDRDGDGFVEYGRRTEEGLINQGWKDSHDSIFHADGSTAHGPIALVEVQGYVYAAKRAAARIARVMGMAQKAEALEHKAAILRRNFEAAFWCEDLSTYALALDGDKRPCRVRSSNAGHALFSGIADPYHAEKVADTLLGGESFSGWGIRTIAATESRYNPMSYHNGSIWPHDNALIALGLARYGLKRHVVQVQRALFDASTYMDLRRLPELFCGFTRRQRKGPTSYPVACAPQAWASATPFGLLQAALGVEFDPGNGEIRFNRPAMPDFLDEMRVTNLGVAEAQVDVLLSRHADEDVAVTVLDRRGGVRVVTTN